MNTVQSNESTRSSLPSQNRFRPRGAIGWLSIALLGMAALFLAGCGGGGSSSSSDGGSAQFGCQGDTISLDDGGGAVLSTEAAAAGPIGCNPLIFAAFDTGSGLTVGLFFNFGAGGPEESLFFAFLGSADATYDIAAAEATFIYSNVVGTVSDMGVTGTFDVTGFGGVGTQFQLTITNVTTIDGVGAPSLTYNGTINVTREVDNKELN